MLDLKLANVIPKSYVLFFEFVFIVYHAGTLEHHSLIVVYELNSTHRRA